MCIFRATGLGRSYTLLSYLRPQARKAATPPDLVYVHNFSDPDRPTLLSLPSGQGKKFKQLLKEAVEAIGKELGRRFEAATYVKQRAKLVDQFQNVRMGLLHKNDSVAVHKGFKPGHGRKRRSDLVSAGGRKAA